MINLTLQVQDNIMISHPSSSCRTHAVVTPRTIFPHRSPKNNNSSNDTNNNSHDVVTSIAVTGSIGRVKSVPIHHAGGTGTCASIHNKKQESVARKMIRDHRRSFQHQNSSGSLGIIEEHHDEDNHDDHHCGGGDDSYEEGDDQHSYFDTECDFSTTDLSLSRLSMTTSVTCVSLADLVSSHSIIDTSSAKSPPEECTMTLSSSYSSLRSFGSGSHKNHHGDEDTGCGTHCYDSNGYHATSTSGGDAAAAAADDDYCFTFDDDMDNYWVG